jgi:hypothetical protein
MRRSALITAVALGAVVCLLGGTVVFSALQDTARTGTNSAESAALGSSADIQLAEGTFNGTTGVIDCGQFSEDLTTGIFTLTGVSPGFTTDEIVCVKNVGSQQVTLSAQTDELTDGDYACTGDEAANGDSTCGGDIAGELSSVLRIGYVAATCTGSGSGGSVLLKDNVATPFGLGTVTPAATKCILIDVTYPASTAQAAVQTAQSDRATWRIRFSAQA